jgi:HTH-type transcriptional regulator/antitoxin HigA
MTNVRAESVEPLPLEYNALVKMHVPRPISDDVGLQNTAEFVNRLAVLDNPTKDQSDYLSLLATIIEEYENEHHQIDLAGLTPLDVVKHLVAESGMKAADLGRLLGNLSLGSAILRGERDLSKASIAALCKHFKVSADLFLR